MAAKNEAKIKFVAETGEFTAGIAKANSTLTKLRSELKLNSTQMKGAGESVELLSKRQEILAQESQASQAKIAALTSKLEKAKEIYGENSTEADRLATQLNNAKNAEAGIQNEIQQVNAALAAQEAAGKETESALSKLENTISQQEDEVSQLKDEYKSAVIEFGEASDEAKELEGKLSQANSELNESKSKMDAAESAANELTEGLKDAGKAGDRLDNVSKKAESVGKSLQDAGKKASIFSAGVVAAGGASVEAFKSVDEGSDAVVIATGATGEAAEQLKESYKNVAGSVVGDFGAIGSALGEVNTRFGFTGSELEACSEDFMKFSKLTGMDATAAVQKVSRYMGDAGIEASDYKGVLDNLAVAAQASGISMDTLSENLTKYGAPMRALGFDTKESIAIFSSWEKAGVNTEIAFSGMKKAISNWSSEGKDSREEFKKTLTEIENCPDIASATTKAIEVFGAKAGPDLADAIQCGRFEYEDMLALIEGSDGALDNTFEGTVDGAYEMELAMQNAKLAAGEVGESLSSTLAPMVEAASQKLRDFANWWKSLDSGTQQAIFTIAGFAAAIGPTLVVLGTVASSISKITATMKMLRESERLAAAAAKIQAGAQAVLNAVMSANPITLVVVAIVALIAIFVTLYNKCEWFREGVNAAFEAVKEGIQKVIDFFKPIVEAFGKVWDTIKGGIDTVAEKFGGFRDKASETWDNVTKDAKEGWDKTKKNIESSASSAKNSVAKNWANIKKNGSETWKNVRNNAKTGWENTKKNIVNAAKSAKDTVGKNWSNLKKNTSDAWNNVKNGTKSGWNQVKNSVGNAAKTAGKNASIAWKSLKMNTASAYNNIKKSVSDKMSGAKTALTSAVAKMKSEFGNLSGLKSTAASVFGSIKSSISDKINDAKNAVSSAIGKIKGMFNFSWSLPKIKLPHFTVKGGKAPWGFGGEGSLPSVSVDWYAKGGILTKPTIFGSNENGLMGGGEAGAEAVLPISTLMDYINAAFDRRMGAVAGDVYNVYVNDAVVNDDAQIRDAAKGLLVELARKGAM